MADSLRSQSCCNCRRPKKRCDFRKPMCSQCTRLEIECAWHDKKRTLFNQVASLPGDPTAIRCWQADPPARCTPISPLSSSSERSLSRTAFEIEWDREFWQSYLPNDKSDKCSIGGVFTAPWTKAFRHLAGTDDTMRVAMSAVSLMTLGRARSDSGLQQQGTILYDRALRATNRALQDPTKCQSDAVLATCQALAMYEIFRFDSTTGQRQSSQGLDWQMHVDGICRIVQLRGPGQHVAGHGLALFENARVSAIICAITRRKANFFTELAWHMVPWKDSPRTLRDELYDIMIMLPRLLEDQDVLLRRLAQADTNRDCFAILTKGQAHVNRSICIAASLQDWEHKALACCLEQSPGPFEAQSRPAALDEICKQFGYGFFQTVMQYWAACVLTYTTAWITLHHLMSLWASFPSATRSLLRPPQIPTWMNPQPISLHMAHNIPHFFSADVGWLGLQHAAFPLGTVLQYFGATTGPQGCEELDALRALLRKARLGNITGDFLRSIGASAGRGKGGDLRDAEQLISMSVAYYGTNPLLWRQRKEDGKQSSDGRPLAAA